MGRAEFVEKYRHQMSGAVLDVLFRNASGGELSILVRSLLRQIDSTLSAAYDDLYPAKPSNGTTTPQTQARKT